MEKFEIDGERNLEVFSSFVSKAKGVLTNLIDNIKGNIKDYESKIEDTTKEISDNEMSREKCEHEITKMEGKIETIKDAIENVENTYKKMVDAYSSTSKGETKELYSEIIDGAKANCEKDVEKNRSEIARLNSDIEAIKNNISEFTKIIDDLNKDLENYNTELFKFTKTLEYLDKEYDKTSNDLEEISSKKEIVKKSESKTTKKTETKKTTAKPKVVFEDDEDEGDDFPVKAAAPVQDKRPSVLDTFETESFVTKKEEEKKVESVPVFDKPSMVNEPSPSYDDSLKQIYDLTGYKPEKSEVAPESKREVEQPKPAYTENLENLFSTPSKDVEPSKDGDMSFLDTEFSNWEDILNAPTPKDEVPVSNEKPKSIDEGMDETVNQLLSPYGTNLARLRSLVAKEISYKDGRTVPFELSSQDVIKAVNSVDGNDLKKMKTVGPEITLLRKVKEMKEGK